MAQVSASLYKLLLLPALSDADSLLSTLCRYHCLLKCYKWLPQFVLQQPSDLHDCTILHLCLSTFIHMYTLCEPHCGHHALMRVCTPMQYVLQFDGRGAYEYKAIDSSTEEFGS